MARMGSFLRFLRGRGRWGTQMPPFSLGRSPYTGSRSILGTVSIIFSPESALAERALACWCALKAQWVLCSVLLRNLRTQHIEMPTNHTRERAIDTLAGLAAARGEGAKASTEAAPTNANAATLFKHTHGKSNGCSTCQSQVPTVAAESTGRISANTHAPRPPAGHHKPQAVIPITLRMAKNLK
jgi:hypothetical protein